jgi:hypothetical protein
MLQAYLDFIFEDDFEAKDEDKDEDMDEDGMLAAARASAGASSAPQPLYRASQPSRNRCLPPRPPLDLRGRADRLAAPPAPAVSPGHLPHEARAPRVAHGRVRPLPLDGCLRASFLLRLRLQGVHRRAQREEAPRLQPEAPPAEARAAASVPRVAAVEPCTAEIELGRSHGSQRRRCRERCGGRRTCDAPSRPAHASRKPSTSECGGV